MTELAIIVIYIFFLFIVLLHVAIRMGIMMFKVRCFAEFTTNIRFIFPILFSFIILFSTISISSATDVLEWAILFDVFLDLLESLRIKSLKNLSNFLLTVSSNLSLLVIIKWAASPFSGSDGFGYIRSCGRNTSNTFFNSYIGDHVWLITSKQTLPDLFWRVRMMKRSYFYRFLGNHGLQKKRAWILSDDLFMKFSDEIIAFYPSQNYLKLLYEYLRFVDIRMKYFIHKSDWWRFVWVLFW